MVFACANVFVGGGASTPRMDERVVQWPTPTTSIVGALNDHLLPQERYRARQGSNDPECTLHEMSAATRR